PLGLIRLDGQGGPTKPTIQWSITYCPAVRRPFSGTVKQRQQGMKTSGTNCPHLQRCDKD
ncbi:MAG: hypothetical protein ACXABM_10880, partial [Candidatus Thorarchaeota archaeon]